MQAWKTAVCLEVERLAEMEEDESQRVRCQLKPLEEQQQRLLQRVIVEQQRVEKLEAARVREEREARLCAPKDGRA
jgi:hypothetical protein